MIAAASPWVDTFSWLIAMLMFSTLTFVLGWHVGRRSVFEHLRLSMQREMAARDELHRLTIALAQRGKDIDG